LLTVSDHVKVLFGVRRSLLATAIVIHMDQIRAGQALARTAANVEGIARRLIAARRAQGLRNTELAAKSGVNKNTISNWETAIKRPSIDQLALVLPVLDVTADFVFFGDDRSLRWEVRERIMAELARLPSQRSELAAALDEEAA
jgi:transcriptional regulator with XRE-family HTH domain